MTTHTTLHRFVAGSGGSRKINTVDFEIIRSVL